LPLLDQESKTYYDIKKQIDELALALNTEIGLQKALTDEQQAQLAVLSLRAQYTDNYADLIIYLKSLLPLLDQESEAYYKILIQIQAIENASQKSGKTQKEVLREILDENATLVGATRTLGLTISDALISGAEGGEIFKRTLKSLTAQAITFAAIWAAIQIFGTGGAKLPSLGKFITANIFGFAEGTPSAPGGLSIVGEKGWELVNLPSKSQVYTHEQSKNIISNMLSTAALEKKLDQVVSAIKNSPPTLINHKIQGHDIVLSIKRYNKNLI